MSSPGTIQHALREGRLRLYEPAFPPRFPTVRTLMLTEEAADQLPAVGRSSHKDIKGEKLANMRAQLEDFVRGTSMYEGQDLRWLELRRRNVWEIKGAGKHGVRLFGWFVAYNCFLGCFADVRNHFPDDAAWDEAMTKCETKRREKYGEFGLFQAPRLSDHGSDFNEA